MPTGANLPGRIKYVQCETQMQTNKYVHVINKSVIYFHAFKLYTIKMWIPYKTRTMEYAHTETGQPFQFTGNQKKV
jgi:hypothetical protein